MESALCAVQRNMAYGLHITFIWSNVLKRRGGVTCNVIEAQGGGGVTCNVIEAQGFDFIECFTTTFLRAHSWLNWVAIEAQGGGGSHVMS